MLTLACGTCGVSIWSMAFPPFGIWMKLIPLAFVVYHFALWRGGEFKSGRFVSHLVVGFVAMVAGVAMLAALVIPVFFLAAILGLLAQLRIKDKWSRIAVSSVLLCFAVSAGWNFYQAKAQGKFWKLGRLQAGSPGRAFQMDAVRSSLFSQAELLELVQSQDATVARNAGEIVARFLEITDDTTVLKSFAQELDALQRAGKADLSPYVLERCRSILKSRLEEPEIQVSPTPTASPAERTKE